MTIINNVKMTQKEVKILHVFVYWLNNKELFEEEGKEIRTNPYSNVDVELIPEAHILYDTIKSTERSLQQLPYSEIHANLHDAALDVFIRNWPTEYMQLLD